VPEVRLAQDAPRAERVRGGGGGGWKIIRIGRADVRAMRGSTGIVLDVMIFFSLALRGRRAFDPRKAASGKLSGCAGSRIIP
jgi:hypothetical protein